MNGTNPKVDHYLAHAKSWQQELAQLRAIILDCKLTEELKWGVPCYTLNGANVVLVHVFKAYCAVLFFKGALLKDPEGILVQQTKNTQASRQIRFTNLQEVVEKKAAVKAYVKEAMAVEKSGLKVNFKSTEAFDMPEEFQSRLEDIPALRTAFEALTPGRQRAYLLHFSEPKQAKTKAARVEKCMPKIFSGKGLDDR